MAPTACCKRSITVLSTGGPPRRSGSRRLCARWRPTRARPSRRLSAPRRLLTESTAVVATVIHMMASWALQHGMVGEDGQLVSLLRSDFAAFANLLRKNLVTLGLERRIKEGVVDLDAYVEAKYGNGKGEGATDRPTHGRANSGDPGGSPEAAEEASK